MEKDQIEKSDSGRIPRGFRENGEGLQRRQLPV